MIRVRQFADALAARSWPMAAITLGSSSPTTSRHTPSGAITVSESAEMTMSARESTMARACAYRLPLFCGSMISLQRARRENSPVDRIEPRSVRRPIVTTRISPA
jgi:hypothetical protein